MGLCNSVQIEQELKSEIELNDNDNDTLNKNIELRMLEEAKRDQQSKKFLLLGIGSSGKSTVFNQLSYIYKTDKKDDKVLGQPIITGQSRINVIRENCLKTILLLLHKSAILYDKDKTKYEDCFVDTNVEQTKNSVKAIKDFPNELFDNEADATQINVENSTQKIVDLGKHIEYVWSLEGVKATFERKELFSIIENLDYFFNQINVVMRPDYDPTPMDILRARIRTTGILEKKIWCKGVPFIVVDVGGQRNERRKWISQFSEITALIYVSAMNHYCRVLFEDENKNAMIESIETFEQIINYKLFLRKHVIMFLNKMDLFDKCIRDRKSLSLCFGDKWTEHPTKIEYEPNDDEKEDLESLEAAKDCAIKFIQEQYASVSKWDRKIYFHTTTATDKESIEKVFWDVQNMVIEKNLHRGGLV